jgi:riboflavin kinase / FMN adenylyltransferase
MELYCNPKSLPKNNYLVTIGNYDGVHLGHQEILNHLREQSYKLNLPSLVIIFEPQPDEYFFGSKAGPRIMTLREKSAAIAKLGIDFILVLKFNEQFANLSAESFISKILINYLQVKYVIIGDDFVFGREGKGDYAMLEKFAEKHHFTAVKTSTFRVSNVRVSSTLIREALLFNNFQLAEKLLGKPYTISGKIAHGNQLGRKLGFPTANIYLHQRVIPVKGVFSVKIWGLENEPLLGIANIGSRPTIKGDKNVLEIHIFEFTQNIYGRRIQVEFLYKIRDEIKFESIEKLRQQIMLDIKQANI